MMLDARLGHTHYDVYDAKRCRRVKDVVWVSTETARWGEYDRSPAGMAHAYGTGFLKLIEHQEDRITIYLDRRLVVFNEVDDSSDDKEPVGVDRPIPEGVPI